jgi:hypothetical protein
MQISPSIGFLYNGFKHFQSIRFYFIDWYRFYFLSRENWQGTSVLFIATKHSKCRFFIIFDLLVNNFHYVDWVIYCLCSILRDLQNRIKYYNTSNHTSVFWIYYYSNTFIICINCYYIIVLFFTGYSTCITVHLNWFPPLCTSSFILV